MNTERIGYLQMHIASISHFMENWAASLARVTAQHDALYAIYRDQIEALNRGELTDPNVIRQIAHPMKNLSQMAEEMQRLESYLVRGANEIANYEIRISQGG